MKITLKHGLWVALIAVMGTGLTLAVMPGKPAVQKDSCCQGKSHSDPKSGPCPMHSPASGEQTISKDQVKQGPVLNEAMLTRGNASDCPYLKASSSSVPESRDQ